MGDGITKAIGEPRLPPSLEEALDAELHRFERITIRVWQLMGAIAVVASLVLAAAVAFPLGIACAVTNSVYLSLFVLAGWRLAEVPGDRLTRAGLLTLEATIPWAFLFVLVFVQGAEYALASWVPPMLFCMLLFVHMIRLRPRTPLLLGIAGGLAFPLVYLLLIRGRLEDEAAGKLLFQLPMQISRSISLVIAGGVTALGARYLRTAIARASVVVREQELFGKYRLIARIARGGMGEVFEALYCPEGGFERRVAVKRIHPHLAEQARFVALFRAEAELCSRLAHPNVVQVMDFGRIEDTYFLAMEYVDGMTLAALMKRSFDEGVNLPEHVVGAIGRDILAGLHHAHQLARGADGAPLRVVHRDLCPQNVLLSRNGELKISDFGVARALKDAESSHTRTVVGHAPYMAPEQARAEAIDARVDLFSVGVILWELLAGRVLFARESEAATVQALMHDEIIPITILRPDIHRGWETFLGGALSRDPADRHGSAREMAAALDAIPSSHGENSARELAALVEAFLEGAAGPGGAEKDAATLVDGTPAHDR